MNLTRSTKKSRKPLRSRKCQSPKAWTKAMGD